MHAIHCTVDIFIYSTINMAIHPDGLFYKWGYLHLFHKLYFYDFQTTNLVKKPLQYSCKNTI